MTEVDRCPCPGCDRRDRCENEEQDRAGQARAEGGDIQRPGVALVPILLILDLDDHGIERDSSVTSEHDHSVTARLDRHRLRGVDRGELRDTIGKLDARAGSEEHARELGTATEQLHVQLVIAGRRHGARVEQAVRQSQSWFNVAELGLGGAMLSERRTARPYAVGRRTKCACGAVSTSATRAQSPIQAQTPVTGTIPPLQTCGPSHHALDWVRHSDSQA